jgi:hypothetical protein
MIKFKKISEIGYCLGVISLIIQAIIVVIMLIIQGNPKIPHVFEVWFGVTILIFLLIGILFIIGYIKDFIID